jgi:hypothetical protein
VRISQNWKFSWFFPRPCNSPRCAHACSSSCFFRPTGSLLYARTIISMKYYLFFRHACLGRWFWYFLIFWKKSGLLILLRNVQVSRNSVEKPIGRGNLVSQKKNLTANIYILITCMYNICYLYKNNDKTLTLSILKTSIKTKQFTISCTFLNLPQKHSTLFFLGVKMCSRPTQTFLKKDRFSVEIIIFQRELYVHFHLSIWK